MSSFLLAVAFYISFLGMIPSQSFAGCELFKNQHQDPVKSISADQMPRYEFSGDSKPLTWMASRHITKVLPPGVYRLRDHQGGPFSVYIEYDQVKANLYGQDNPPYLALTIYLFPGHQLNFRDRYHPTQSIAYFDNRPGVHDAASIVFDWYGFEADCLLVGGLGEFGIRVNFDDNGILKSFQNVVISRWRGGYDLFAREEYMFIEFVPQE